MIVVAIGLLVAVFWPQPFEHSADDQRSGTTDNSDSVISIDSSTRPHREEPPLQPLRGVPHPLFPLVKGVRWVYLVSDSSGLAPASQWSLEIVEVPGDDTPGRVEMGFGDQLHIRDIHFSEDGVQLFDLPFSAPLDYVNSTSYQYEGHWLPPEPYLVDDAVWKYTYRRKIKYRSQNKHREIVEEDAVGVQTERATMKRQEKVVVPAGVFQSYLVSYGSRMEILAGTERRKVLQKLTTEPFRRETVWFAPGVGMVRRRITYNTPEKVDIIFNLVRFENPLSKNEH
ncbi:MAG: hypothetical protein JXR76_05895 [Deltaproteobacteria bacterium]|nr:hypothetical protein [Deltaproteobacteria bacterium]